MARSDFFRCVPHFVCSGLWPTPQRLRSGKLKSLRANILRGIPNAVDVDSIMADLSRKSLHRPTPYLHLPAPPEIQAACPALCDLEGTAIPRRGPEAVIPAPSSPWDIMAPSNSHFFSLGDAGFDVIQLGLPTAEGLSWVGRNVAFRLRLKYEKMIPVRILPADEFLRPLFHHLKCNGVVMMNIDPAGGGRWLGRLTWIPFFGHPIPFPLGPALLSAKTGAPIIPLSIHRRQQLPLPFQAAPRSCTCLES